ncbi:hypothetical protein NE237_015150 [Protea cynaroides]|uniref:Uncharacterized protein n=1 Tax=Protea cynaroides TaxID=273540 RepID=A0A9Q0KDI0_9MAGN|nr:hypothetical protein NE237_015150 [Protea cynaroides]
MILKIKPLGGLSTIVLPALRCIMVSLELHFNPLQVQGLFNFKGVKTGGYNWKKILRERRFHPYSW